MDESDYWVALEYRICREFDGFNDDRLRPLWCDGLAPEEWELAADRPAIRGLAWCGRTGQDKWRFTLLLTTRPSSREEIQWGELLPPDDHTGWLSADPERRSLVIDPGAGVPD
jgi:hypothetical protein